MIENRLTLQGGTRQNRIYLYIYKPRIWLYIWYIYRKPLALPKELKSFTIFRDTSTSAWGVWGSLVPLGPLWGEMCWENTTFATEIPVLVENPFLRDSYCWPPPYTQKPNPKPNRYTPGFRFCFYHLGREAWNSNWASCFHCAMLHPAATGVSENGAYQESHDHYKWKMMRNQQKPDKPTFLGGKEDAEIQAMWWSWCWWWRRQLKAIRFVHLLSMHQAGIQHANDVNIPWSSLLAEAKVSTGSPWSNRITLVAKLKLGSRIQVACCKKHQYPEIHHFCAIKKLPHPLSLALINRKK